MYSSNKNAKKLVLQNLILVNGFMMNSFTENFVREAIPHKKQFY